MWPLGQIQQYIAEMAKRQHPLRSYEDTLSYLVGGQPDVVERRLFPGTFGAYVPIQPSFGILKDTITLSNRPKDWDYVNKDFTYAHEMGHRLYYDNEPLPAGAERQGASAPLLQEIVKSLHRRNPKYSNEDEGEGFAQAFGQAVQTVRGRPYTPPKATGLADSSDVRRFEEWIRRRLAQRAPR